MKNIINYRLDPITLDFGSLSEWPKNEMKETGKYLVTMWIYEHMETPKWTVLLHVASDIF